MKPSVLHSIHEELGAHFVALGDRSIPAHYGDHAAEHLAVRKTAGIADISHRGMLQVTGDDRVTWLQSIVSQDLRPLQPGKGCYSAFMSAKGKILSCFRVYLQPEAVLVEDVGEVGDQTFQAFRKFLLYGTKAKIKSLLESWGILLVSGPLASKILEDSFSISVKSLAPLCFVSFEIDGQYALVARTEETGEEDFELFASQEVLPSAWKRISAVGTPFGLRPFGSEARESLRLEAGIPRLGPDLNDQIVPPEANLEGKAFSLSKGCYPGQEVVARMDTYGSVKRRLVGLTVQAPAGTVLSPGTKVFRGDREVGWISSAGFSPSLNQLIALAFPLRDFTAPETELEVEREGRRYPSTVHSLPFLTSLPS